MTTSNTFTVQYTRDQLLTAAMRKLGVLADGQTPSANNYSDGTMCLNMAVSMYRALGMTLWTRAYYPFSTTEGTSSYNIGTGQVFGTPYPLKVLQLYRDQDGTRIDMDIEADYNFNQLPVSSSGVPIKATYQPKNNYGVLQLWPTPDSSASSSTFTLVYQKPFQYFISSTDTADFPEEWYTPLVYQTAVLWAPEWGVPLPDREKLDRELQLYLNTVLSMGGEDSSMFIQPYRQP
jgi:hypothetical protein